MSSLVEMDLFDDPNESAALESHAVSDDDLPSEEDDDDDDDDDDELNTTDMAHVRWFFLFKANNTLGCVDLGFDGHQEAIGWNVAQHV